MARRQWSVRQCSAAVLLGAVAVLCSGVSAQDLDPNTGLIIAQGWQAVRTTCTECHSASLITQNAGNKAVWRERLRWMQETQGLRSLEIELETSILDYLSEHYGERAPSRRAALPPELLPDNPYSTLND